MTSFTLEEILEMQRALQERYKHKWEPICPENGKNKMLWMIGEIGEVAEVLNKRAGRKFSEGEDLQTQLGTELADMLHYIVAIAAINGIDLTQNILEKDKKASVKYHHDVNLETFLSDKSE